MPRPRSPLLFGISLLLAGTPAGAGGAKAKAGDDAAPPSVLLVLAHPDDETMVGGLLGRLKERGIPVRALYVTRGEGGKMVKKVKGRLVLVDVDPRRLAAIRGDELKEAARRLGIGEVRQLREPDAPLRNRSTGLPTRDARAFLSGGVWNVQRVRNEIQRYAEELNPEVVITMLPSHRAIHAHHKAVGHIVRGLFDRHRLGSKARQVYAVHETDWYPGAFQVKASDLVLPRRAFSKALGKTYGAFAVEGAAAHKSQPPGHRAFAPKADRSREVLVPLLRSRRGRHDPLRKILARLPVR